MADLRACLTSLGLLEVKTFLQTGNVVFESDEDADVLKPTVEKVLSERFGYKAFVMLYPLSILSTVIREYPFVSNEDIHRYAIFCKDDAVIADLLSHRDELDDSIEDIARGKHVVYWCPPKGSTLDTAFSKIIAKPKYSPVTTNRTLNTLEKMI